MIGQALALLFGALAVAGCLYTLVAARLVARFGRPEPAAAASGAAVTVLKPLHGAEPFLHENLMSFLAQDHAGPVQVVFGVQNPQDAAIPVVEAIIRAMPERDLALVVDAARHGSNPKVSNLINMMGAARHDVLVLADSDIRVGPDYLARVVAALERPGIGAVTCPYRGGVTDGLWSRLAGLQIDSHFLPSVVVGLAGGLAAPCFGATIALRRQTLERIGGFRALADVLADDYAVGHAVRGLGLAVAVTPFLVTHRCNDASLAEMLRHEIRWAKTVAGLDRLGHVGSGLTHPLPLAILALSLTGLSGGAGILVAAAFFCRSLLLWSVARRFGLQETAYGLLPLRDCLSFLVYLASFVPTGVHWRGHDFRVRMDGTMVARREGDR
ncbi:bacteriohopanetetrol glucosamine biosynthesis glycosyltransferase HpnI [Labrys wisconsinensis]|uniref:Ceramide glucosyltransferase n=1 Tax=Labrys wisconsinensis TaxID=425677 RepID=A0ABU0J8G8_9HYPH|nr:bacteriohopanetetrol glucosamine biosynthesis glycosyltransferase HpnI [Labrys wisconsinensis]MDQ0470568.1 ceramide glucosyltransferase [Labrys wisconsinensis]